MMLDSLTTVNPRRRDGGSDLRADAPSLVLRRDAEGVQLKRPLPLDAHDEAHV